MMSVRGAHSLITCLTLASFLLGVTANGQGGHFTPFDQYGRITWEDEQARLDNFAIQLLNEPDLIGYILVYDGNNICAGEAQAQAMRAKRYVIEHRGVQWNRVIWRIDGYFEEFMTYLQPVSRSFPISYPLLEEIMRSPRRHVTRNCHARIAEIKKAKW